MDVSGISNTSVSQNQATRYSVPIAAHGAEKSHDTDHQYRPRSDAYQDRALGIFRQELRSSFESHFRARFSIIQPNYSAVQGEATSEDVATEALGAAQQLVSESPTRSGRALITFRSRVHETASYVRETANSQENTATVDDAVGRIDDGLDALETKVADNRESTATVLTVDAKSKQRSTIRIRTQEGDVVKLSLRKYDRVSASDNSVTSGEETSSSTEVEVSSRSRMMLRVDGDLNENELAAIQNVFSQAEEIANQFFGGDISAALDLATGFEFDSEQLARVRLGFRNFQSSNVTYSESTRSLPTTDAAIPTRPVAVEIAAPRSPAEPAAVRPVSIPSPVTAVPSAVESVSIPSTVTAEQVQDIVEPLPASPPTRAIDTSVFSDFFSLVSDFLRSIGDGFEASGASGSTSVRLHYSESFKLEILGAVINATAPEQLEDAASTATLIIDGIANGDDQEPLAV